MPYINQTERPILDELVETLASYGIEANGDLAYVLYAYCKRHIPNKYNAIKNFRAELIETGDEIRRRLMEEREDAAIKENGDVY